MSRSLRTRSLPVWLGLALMGLVSCASGRYVVLEPASAPLKSYSILEVSACSSNQNEEHAVKLADGFPDQVVGKLAQFNKAHPNAPLFAEVVRSTDQTDGVIQMQSVLLNYEKGSKALRYLIGFGAGKAYCTVQCTFVDKRTGQQVLKANFEGELSMGFFGGSADQASGKVLDEIVTYLQKNY